VRLSGKIRNICFLFLLGFILLLFSCGGLQKAIKERAEGVPSRIDEAAAQLEKYKNEFDKFKKRDEYKSEFHLYAAPDREDWENNFSLSDNEIKRAQEVYDNDVSPILKRNDRKEEPELRKKLKLIDDTLIQGTKLARKTSLRISELHEAKKNAKEMTEQAKADYADVSSIFSDLETYVYNTREQFPNKKDDLDTRLLWFKTARDNSDRAQASVTNEMESSSPDYAVFANSCLLLSTTLKDMTGRDKTLRKKISELERDYSKILRDMKIDQRPWMEEVKYQWNNWSDFDTTREVYRRKRYISMDDYNRIIGRYGEEGGILSRGSDYEIWVEGADIEEHYYHKYLIVENDKETVTDWVEVTEEVYEANEDNLNMSIASKPFGYYEDEVINAATPPGFDKVGNPRYGRWVENRETGHREWSFFERYLFWHMVLNGIGPRHNYYTYGRWDDWNRNYRGRRAYYGTGGSDFGSAGRTTSANPSVRNSAFAKSGGFKSARSSVRGAGSSMRGRGPGSGK
jgi:hypothetical protein